MKFPQTPLVYGGSAMAYAIRIFHASLMFSQSLVAALSEDERFSASVANGISANELVAGGKLPDVAIIDLHLPDHFAVILTQRIFANANSAKVILLLANVGNEGDLLECVEAGVQGCILEKSSLEDLKQAISEVVAGGVYFSPEMACSVFRKFAENSRNARNVRQKPDEITPRELEIARLIQDGLSNKQIASRLSLSIYTVKNHVHNLIAKLDVDGRVEVAEYVKRHHWRRWIDR